MSFQSSKALLTEGPIRSHLIRMTIPMIWGILAIISFQLVDTYYISLLGTEKLASFSYTFPITYGIFSIFIGMGIGMSSVISRLLGAKDYDNVKRVTSHGLLLVFLISLVVAAIGLLILNPLLRSMGASPEQIADVRSYMIPYFIGTFFVSMPVVGNAALRASGDAVIPALIMTIAAIANALIAPLFVFGLYGFPRLELYGAALATVAANFCAMVSGIYFMYRRGLFDLSHIRNLEHFGDSAKSLMMIGLPAGLTSMLPSVLQSFILALLSKSGAAAVAAFGAASRVEAFTQVIMMALSIGLAPVVGQNWGAKLFGRVHGAVKEALIFSVLWSGLSAAILLIFAHSIAGLFSDDTALQAFLVLYFMIVPLSYPLGNITHGWGSVFNAIGKPQYSAGFLFLKMIILLIPATYIGNHLGGALGIFIAIAAVNILTGLGVHFWSWAYLKKSAR